MKTTNNSKIILIILLIQVQTNAQELISESAWVWSSAVQNKKGKTDSLVFEKLAQIEAGSPVVLSQVPRAESSLLRMGYFSKTGETKLYRIANRNRIVPAFNLTDATANFAEASIAFEAGSNEYNGLVRVQLMNIAGSARDFSLAGENSKNYRAAEIFYKEPFIFGLNGSLKLHGEFMECDSIRQRNADLKYIHNLSWEWQYGIGGGYKNNKLFSSLLLGYDSRDKVPLAFKGLFAEMSAEFSEFVAAGLNGAYYQPFSKNWTLLLSAKGFGMLPPEDYAREDLFLIGGKNDFIGLIPRSIRTRAYGLSEMDFQWHGLEKSALHIFGQNGIYRNRMPFRGWKHILTYGLGWEQGISNASLAIYYALSQDMLPMDGLLNLSLRIGF
ncbi:MAG: outer membrane protein assembly factor [Fibromonadales bacterium]|nr:outer membrane protein assembly factor [Fibromonadales bacterium]